MPPVASVPAFLAVSCSDSFCDLGLLWPANAPVLAGFPRNFRSLEQGQNLLIGSGLAIIGQPVGFEVTLHAKANYCRGNFRPHGPSPEPALS
jgi:hypothetical protein